MSLIVLERITVLPDRVEAIVRDIAPGAHRPRSPEAVTALLALLPGLAGHRCSSERHRSFAEELERTSLAHVLEHVTLEVMAMAGSPRTLRGETRREAPGLWRVSILDDDDAVCVGSLRIAVAAIEHAYGDAPAPDVARAAADLRALRRCDGPRRTD